MFAATRRWFRRNRTPLTITVGLLGAGYVVTQYVVSKLNEARERMGNDRIAKENLRRRFQQNQEDCTYTVLALLPSAAKKILEALDVEHITLEIQQLKGAAANGPAKSVKSGSADSMSLPETTGMTDDDGRSMVSASESGVHASQVTLPPTSDPGEQAQPEKPKRTKRQLWGDVTISSITRAYTLVYTLALLTMLTRIQLNLLGRRSYLSSVVSLATGSNTATISLENKDDDSSTEAYGDDFEVNRKYLTFSWWLLNKGWTDVMQRVEAAVRQVFGQTSPRDQVTFETFSNMTKEVRRLVEGGAPGPVSPTTPQQTAGASRTQWLRFLLPTPDMEDYVLRESGIIDDSAASQTQSADREPSTPTATASLRRLLDESSDLIESPTFSYVLTQILDAGFSVLLDRKLAEGPFDLPPPPTSPAAAAQIIVDVSADVVRDRAEKKVLLPKCLSILTKQAHHIGNGMPNEYLQAMEGVQDLEGFAAVVYSSNWENEIHEEGLMLPASSSVGSPRTGPTGTMDASLRQSAALVPGEGEESMVLVEPTQSSFESVWAKVTHES